MALRHHGVNSRPAPTPKRNEGCNQSTGHLLIDTAKLALCLIKARADQVGCDVHVPIVPMSVKAPVALSMLYIETLFELEFVT
jgi:hypothetical protein